MTDPLPNAPPPDVSFGIPARAPAPKKKASNTKTLLIVLGAGFGVLVLLAVGFGALIYAAATREGSTATVKPTDREYLITYEDLGRHVPGLEKMPGTEKITRGGLFGSHELTYEYQQPDNMLYLHSSLSIDGSASDARNSYNGMELGMKLMLKAQGEDIVIKDRDELLKWGDASHVWLMESKGNPVGNLFLARKENRVYFLTVSGAYFDDPAAFSELVTPKLEKMSSYQP